MDESLKDTIKKALWMFMLLMLILSVFVIFQIFTGSKSSANYDTITVDAEAEIFAVPDIAEISFTVRSEDKEIAKAQSDVEARVKPALEALEKLGIDKKDIKTTSYNVNPRYEYGKLICEQYRCDDGQRALVGYEANQSVSLKIRNLDNVSKVLATLGENRVTDFYGPNFQIEDEEALKAQVREDAIAKAKEKGKVLAKNLDVRIVGIENFQENAYGGIYYAKDAMEMNTAVMNESAPAFEPSLPQGENKIQTSVTITYRVK